MILENFDDKIVVFGMSCVGKTTFSKTLTEHTYYCFDYLFQWHCIETFGLSITENFKHIKEQCTANKFILDGWHLADSRGQYLPPDSAVYVIWAPYEKIISQYRVKVYEPDEHISMYHKWYIDIDYSIFDKVRYFSNLRNFEEISRKEFLTSLERNQ